MLDGHPAAAAALADALPDQPSLLEEPAQTALVLEAAEEGIEAPALQEAPAEVAVDVERVNELSAEMDSEGAAAPAPTVSAEPPVTPEPSEGDSPSDPDLLSEPAAKAAPMDPEA